MLRLEMAALLNPESIWDNQNIFKLMQVNENEKYQAVSLSK